MLAGLAQLMGTSLRRRVCCNDSMRVLMTGGTSMQTNVRTPSPPVCPLARGRAAADTDSLARAVERLSVLAGDLGEHLDGVDINPLVVSARGCVAVDALVISRSAAPQP